jgi:hypothetical protein
MQDSEYRPKLDDPNWRTDVSAAEPPMWVIWNHGYGRRLVGEYRKHLTRTDDAEAWMPKPHA